MSKRRLWLGWLFGAGTLAVLLAVQFRSADRSLFLPGETTDGHHQIELACEACHTPFGGVRQAACLDCHAAGLEAALDSHPPSKFTDPRNAFTLERIDARLCVTCHVEHSPEATGAMGVTQPVDFCVYCHADVASERPSHQAFGFDTCGAAGCHNYHDNRGLYEEFLVENAGAAPHLANGRLRVRTLDRFLEKSLGVALHDAPPAASEDPILLEAWAASGHAASGVNCSGCHVSGSDWTDRPPDSVCRSCHAGESSGFLQGRHGMRLAAGLEPMSPAMARLPMLASAGRRELGCTSCHEPHAFDTRRAAVEACLGCHADRHSLAYTRSPHYALWREDAGGAAPGSGVSCATCHLPRTLHREGGVERVRVEHNQSANLRPNEKMLREVCLSCHGLPFSIDALADPLLIERNFDGPPGRHIESIDMAVRRAAESMDP